MSNSWLKFSLVAVVVWALNSFAGDVEGRFFPVVSDVSIDKMEPAANGYTRIWGSFHLSRANCDFAGLSWSLVGIDRNVLADLIFEGGTSERTGGGQSFGPWLVQLTPDQIKNRSLSVAHHACPYRLWKTETVFYPQG